MDALGLIETKGFVGAIVAADTALKAANVSLLNAEVIKGGYVTVQLSGDVAAVKAAVDAGSEVVESVGTLISAHVIPRMHTETNRLVKRTDNEPADQATEDMEINEKQSEQSKDQPAQVAVDPEKKEADIIKAKSPESSEKPVVHKKEKLEKMTVNQLRTLARKTNVMKDQPEKIKTSKKAELIHHLLKANDKH